MEKRRVEFGEKGIPVNVEEKECVEKLREMLEIEELGHKVELDLNEVLKKTRSLVGGFRIGRGVDKSLRTQEMENALGLVTKHEDVLIQISCGLEIESV
jgi:hypothetical protein